MASRMRQITDRFQYFLSSARRLALCDPLTQLPNRRYFLEYLGIEAERQRQLQGRFAIFFVDVDQFKAINDTYGHDVGDQALVVVAERLRGLMRSGDFLARYGGDEFVVLIPLKAAWDGPEADLRRHVYDFASRIASCFDEVLQLGPAALEINLSIGVAVVNPAEINPQEAMKRSDEAMYRAKLHKTSRIAIFNVDDEAPNPNNYPLYVDLIAALRDRDLRIEFQPVVDADGKPQGEKKVAVGPVAALIDGVEQSAWESDRGGFPRHQPSVAVAQFAQPLDVPEGTRLKLELRMLGAKPYAGDRRMLGCFRASLTTQPAPTAPPIDHAAVLAIRKPAADRTPADSAAIFAAWRKTVADLD
jgi:diguanylate cyclase (GGDEF)-like protein